MQWKVRASVQRLQAVLDSGCKVSEVTVIGAIHPRYNEGGVDMKTRCERALALGSVAMFLALGEKSSATESELVQDLTGPVSCTSLTIDKIKELSDVPPPPLNGLIDADGQVITYTIDTKGDTLLEFTSTKPVNFTMLGRLGQGGRVFYYGEGVTHDTDLQAGGIITLVRFCYALSLEPQPLAKCDPALCNPQDNAVLVRLDPELPQWTVEACTCGSFVRCDPTLMAGAEGACEPLRADPPPFVPVPVKVEAGQDPWVCFTIGGKQKCYCQDLDKSKKGCQ